MRHAIGDLRPADPVPSAIERLFGPLFAREASGSRWLGELLRATPGAATLGELADQPGWLQTALAVRGARERLACFEYPSAPSLEWLLWMVDHPDALTVPADQGEASAATRRLREALIADTPPGARARAQDQAHTRARSSSPYATDWWRLEDAELLDCILITDRLVVTVVVRRGERLPPATPWYPQRSVLVRAAETARQAAPDRAWATLLLSDRPQADGEREAFTASLPAGAPHLDDHGRAALGPAYLGELSFVRAAEVTTGALAG